MGNSPSADLGGGSAHSSRDVRTVNPEMEVKRSLASRAPTHNEYNELPASSKPHNTSIKRRLSNKSRGLLAIYRLVRVPGVHSTLVSYVLTTPTLSADANNYLFF